MNGAAGPVPHELTLELSRAERAADPYAFQPVRQEYRRRDRDGTYRSATFPWGEQMERDLAELERPGLERARVQRLGEALRAFLVELGWEHDELRLRQAVDAGRPVHVTCRFAAAELYALPWELVTLSTTRQHLGELPGCIVQYEWPGTQTAPPLVSPPLVSPPPEGGRLLFACSADVPADLHLLALRQACARRKYPFDPKGDFLSRVSLAGLAEALAASSEPIAALHILCHGARTASGTYGLVWHPSGPLGQVEVLDAATLRQALGTHARRIRMVVLCACSGADPGPPGSQLGSAAQALHQIGIPAVVAFRFPISKHGSVRLTEALYGELLGGSRSLQEALSSARGRLAQESGGLDWASLQLYARAEDGPHLRPFIIRPYRGLLPFEPHHQRFFFGREAIQQAVLKRIQEAAGGARPRFQVVAGASSSGKSSLVMAGVLPALDPAAWELLILRPGNASALEEAQRWNKSGRHLLVVVDQFEEAFTRIRDPAERQGFFQKLWELARGPEPSVVVIGTLRLDHFEDCREIRLEEGGLLLEAVVRDETHHIFVPQMKPEQQEAAIRGPAQAVGLELEEGLVERLRRDVGQEPGALSLLEHVLDLLWQQREGNRLTHRAYDAMGGTSGVLADAAEGTYRAFSPKQRFQLRRLMIELVELRQAAAPQTRRRVFRDRVRPAGRKARATFDSVVESMVERRLLILGAEMETAGAAVWIEIVHEALIHRWKRLRRWIQEDRERSTQLRELNAWAEAWMSHRGNPDGGASYLLTGDRLGHARKLQEQHASYLAEESARFIDESWGRSLEERSRERRVRRRQVWLTVGLAAFLAMSTGLGALTFRLWKPTGAPPPEVLRDGWLSKVRSSISRGDSSMAALMLLEPGEIGPQTEEWTALALQVLEKPVARVTFYHPKAVPRARFSPDGKKVATACEDGLVRVWAVDGPALELSGHGDMVFAVEFSPDGTRLVSASDDRTARVWSLDRKGPPVVLAGHEGEVRMAAFSPDGTRVVTASMDRTARVWSSDGKGAPVVLAGHEGEVRSAAFSPDGTRVVTASNGGLARVWRADGKGKPVVLKGHDGDVVSAAFSPDGRLVVTASGDKTARIWRADGTVVAVLRGHRRTLWCASFSPRGDRVVTCSLDGKARVWSLDGKLEATLPHKDRVWTANFSPDGQKIVTGSTDKTARVWSVEGRELQVLRGYDWEIAWAEFSPQGDRVLTASADHMARIWRADQAGDQIELRGHQGPVTSASFSPDGERVLTTSSDGTARLWAKDGQGKPLDFRPGTAISSAAFSPDGKQVAVASVDGMPRMWSAVHEAAPLVFTGHGGPLSTVSFSPDGTRFVTASDDGTARIWRTGGEGEPVVLGGGQGKCRFAAFSPDGERVVTASSDGTVHLWKSDGREPLLVLKGHTGAIQRATFSPDGRRLLTASEDGTARVWRTDREGESIVLAKDLGQEKIAPVAFSPDGMRVLAISNDGAARVWSAEGRGTPLELRHGARVLSASFSPDGLRILTASEDATARVWRVDKTQEQLEFLELRGHRGPVLAAGFSPDGQWAVTGSADGTARVWALSVAALQARLRAATIACIPSWQRQRHFLDPGEALARKKFEDCERSYGRLP